MQLLITKIYNTHMGVNIDKLKQIAVPLSAEEKKIAEESYENREALRYSAMIALAIRRELRLKGISQQSFAEQMGVSAQYFGRILKGKENLTLTTIGRIERVIGRPIFDVLVEEKDQLHACHVFYHLSFNINKDGDFAEVPRRSAKWDYLRFN